MTVKVSIVARLP